MWLYLRKIRKMYYFYDLYLASLHVFSDKILKINLSQTLGFLLVLTCNNETSRKGTNHEKYYPHTLSLVTG